MGKEVDCEERLVLVEAEENRLGIPSVEDPRWRDAIILGIAGCFHMEFPELFINFGGYLLVMDSGFCRGMMIDMFGSAVVIGIMNDDSSALDLIKIYCVFTSNMTAEQPITYKLESEDFLNFEGKWYFEPNPNSRSVVSCSIFPTQMTTKSFTDPIRSVHDEELQDLLHEEYLALCGKLDDPLVDGPEP